MIKSIFYKFIGIIVHILYPFYYIKQKYWDRFIIILNSELVRLYLLKHNQIVGKNFRIGLYSKININRNSKLIIGDNVLISDNAFINVKNNATLEIDDNVHIGKGTRVSSFKSVKIGKDTLIASYCNILDHNHFFDLKSSVKSDRFISDAIVIAVAHDIKYS